MTWFLLCCNLWLTAAHDLGAESYDVRARTSAWLGALGPFGLPSAGWAYYTGDLEQQRRARYLTDYQVARVRDLGYDALAWWLFYGPDLPPRNRARSPLASTLSLWNRRSVRGSRWEPALRAASLDFYAALIQRAIRWKLELPTAEPTLDPDNRIEWLDRIRHRVASARRTR